MKKASFLGCVLLFVSIAGFGQTQSQAPLSREALAAILGLPAPSSCAVRPSAQRQAAKHPAAVTGKSLCDATAICDTGSVSCSSNASVSNCSSADRSCDAGERGHVTCDGVTTWCPNACPPPCQGLTGIDRQCCICDTTNDCIACCRCDGGTLGSCSRQCG